MILGVGQFREARAYMAPGDLAVPGDDGPPLVDWDLGGVDVVASGRGGVVAARCTGRPCAAGAERVPAPARTHREPTPMTARSVTSSPSKISTRRRNVSGDGARCC